MNIIYYFVIYILFIIASIFVCKNNFIDDKNKKNSIGFVIFKSSLTSILAIVFISLFNIVIFILSDALTGPGVFALSYFSDIILPICIIDLVIYLISKFFKYEIKIPVWIFIVTVLCMIIVAPFYIYNLKMMFNMIDGFKDGTVDFLRAFTYNNNFLNFVIRFLTLLPCIVMPVFFVIKKINKK